MQIPKIDPSPPVEGKCFCDYETGSMRMCDDCEEETCDCELHECQPLLPKEK